MARTAKTQHVMDLVGTANQKRANPSFQERTPPVQGESVSVAIPVSRTPMTSLQELQKRQELEELKQALAAVESELVPQNEVEEESPAEGYNDNSSESSVKDEETAEGVPPAAAVTVAEEKPNRICAVVLELINQELEAVTKRFRIEPTDNNLWELTRAVLESVRPEFALTPEDLQEKCDRLRPRVISEMAKIAIKIAKRKAE